MYVTLISMPTLKRIQTSFASEIAAETSNVIAIETSNQIVISEKEYRELKWEIGCWRGRHERALLREKVLKKIIKEKDGQIRDLKNRLFGKKTEKKETAKKDGEAKDKPSKRPRGQQPGSKGHGRTKRPDLPHTDEPVNFPNIPQCANCLKNYIPDGSKKSEIIEVEVKAYTRIIIRDRMKKDCSCDGQPDKVIAPMPPRVIPKSPYGITIWESVLLNKFRYCQPTNRLIKQYAEQGLPISAGTITGGLKVIKDLFQPIYDALYEQQMTENRFHNDESGWKVFESVDGKIGNKWWLWVCRSASVVFFQIAPGRGADVPVEHFKDIKHQKIIVICDRYSAYK